MLIRIIFGLVVATVGAIITLKSEWLLQNFGSIPEAEKYLGTSGGSRLAYKLIGITVSIIGFLIMTNLISGILTSTVKALFIRN